MVKQKKKKTRWQKINGIILTLNIIFPVWIMALMYTSAISDVLFLIAVFSLLLNGVVYKLNEKFHKGRCFLYIARGIVISAWTVFYMPMLILMNFSHSQLIYPLKRFCYTYGVFGSNAAFYQQLLPEELPEICDDYSFRTQGSMVAQDYHPSSYLMFHTDTASLEAYVSHFDALDCARLENGTEDGDFFQNKIEWFCGQMGLRESFQDNLDNAVLYWFAGGMYPKAVLLNFETGLVAVLT